MSAEEADDLIALIRRIVAEMKCGVLLIEHNIGLVLNICDHIHVLDSGEIIEDGTPGRDQGERESAPRLYGHAGRSRKVSVPMTLLTVDNITVRYGRLTALRAASLSVDEGETLFITGPNGAGKSTLLKAIAGVVPVAEGSITLDGKVISGRHAGRHRAPRLLHGAGRPPCLRLPHHRGESDAGRRHARRPGPRGATISPLSMTSSRC